MKQKPSSKKTLVLAAALASLVGTVALNPSVAFADDHDTGAGTKKEDGAKCGSHKCAGKKEKEKNRSEGR